MLPTAPIMQYKHPHRVSGDTQREGSIRQRMDIHMYIRIVMVLHPFLNLALMIAHEKAFVNPLFCKKCTLDGIFMHSAQKHAFLQPLHSGKFHKGERGKSRNLAKAVRMVGERTARNFASREDA